MILAPDTIDYALAAHARLSAGDESWAEAAYREMLATTVFIRKSLRSLTCYGNRLFGARAGIDTHDRAPALRPTAFGLDLVRRHAARLESYQLVLRPIFYRRRS